MIEQKKSKMHLKANVEAEDILISREKNHTSMIIQHDSELSASVN